MDQDLSDHDTFTDNAISDPQIVPEQDQEILIKELLVIMVDDELEAPAAGSKGAQPKISRPLVKELLKHCLKMHSNTSLTVQCISYKLSKTSLP
ncbi:hypothetical protein C0991_011205 [Blastosporella zonata]|nr:hypothetical protein C0991_011205 [Blastosporella zonata]